VEENSRHALLVAFIIGLAVGAFGTGLWSYFRQSEQARRYNDELARIEQRTTERQRALADNNSESAKLAANAGAIAERSGERLRGDSENIAEAGGVIADLYKQIQEADGNRDHSGSGGGIAGVDSGPGD
jgi:uncharacterized protein HemX